jgi:hypothetical protein
MADPIKDPDSLPGETVHDQGGERLGKVEHLYAPGGGDDPMWAAVKLAETAFKQRLVYIPLARIKHEDGQIRVPYSIGHISESPEVEADDEISPEDDARLRDFYAIDRGDEEIRTDSDSYAAQVPDSDEPSKRV